MKNKGLSDFCLTHFSYFSPFLAHFKRVFNRCFWVDFSNYNLWLIKCGQKQERLLICNNLSIFYISWILSNLWFLLVKMRKNGERHLLTFPKSNLFESQKWQIAQISISQDLLIVKWNNFQKIVKNRDRRVFKLNYPYKNII